MYFKEAYIETLIKDLGRQVLTHPSPESYQGFQWDIYIAKSLLQKAIRRYAVRCKCFGSRYECIK